MKITAACLSTLALAYTAAADSIIKPDHDPASYNASSSVTYMSYDISNEHTDRRSNWTITSGLIEEKDYILNVVTLSDDNFQPGKIAKGWEICSGVYWGKRRKDAGPVPKDCSGFLSDKCIEGLKKTGNNGDGKGCSLQKVPAECEMFTDASGQRTYKIHTQRMNVLTQPATEYTSSELANATSGLIELSSKSNEKKGNGTAVYDDYLTNVTIVSAYWSNDGGEKPLGDVKLSCLGFDTFKEGSRNVTAVLGSSAPAVKMSLVAGVAALLLAL